MVKNIDNKNVKNDFVGVYPSNHINRFPDFHKLMVKKSVYPYFFLNTDTSGKPDTYWWSAINIHPKKGMLLFDCFGSNGPSKELKYEQE